VRAFMPGRSQYTCTDNLVCKDARGPSGRGIKSRRPDSLDFRRLGLAISQDMMSSSTVVAMSQTCTAGTWPRPRATGGQLVQPRIPAAAGGRARPPPPQLRAALKNVPLSARIIADPLCDPFAEPGLIRKCPGGNPDRVLGPLGGDGPVPVGCRTVGIRGAGCARRPRSLCAGTSGSAPGRAVSGKGR
jgi:hypothetical protein